MILVKPTVSIYDKCSGAELRKACKDRRLPREGTKADMIGRLTKWDKGQNLIGNTTKPMKKLPGEKLPNTPSKRRRSSDDSDEEEIGPSQKELKQVEGLPRGPQTRGVKELEAKGDDKHLEYQTSDIKGDSIHTSKKKSTPKGGKAGQSLTIKEILLKMTERKHSREERMAQGGPPDEGGGEKGATGGTEDAKGRDETEKG